MRFFASTARGTEAVLVEELSELGLGAVEERRGGAAFEGDLGAGYRACLWSRVSSRILLEVGSFEAPDADALYAGAHAIDWANHLGPEQTLAVSAVAPRALDTVRFLVLRTKDAIVDRLREDLGARPNIDRRTPDVRVHVHLGESVATVSIDLSGDSLHRRGLGRRGAAAPLKESLAAAVLRMAGWPALAVEGTPLLDPMCGSATLLIEAASMALQVAPGLTRARHGFEGWRGHDAAMWRGLVKEARELRAAGARRRPDIHGFDASAAAVRTALDNVASAGFVGRVVIERGKLAERAPVTERDGSPRGLLVTNPPYGERLGRADELGPLYAELGDLLRRRFLGWNAWVLAGNPDLAKQIGLRPRSRRVLFNGPIECRLLEIPIAAEPVRGESKPAWRGPGPDAPMLANRLRKNLTRLRRWAKRGDVHCYRVYDADIPEYNLAVDVYDGRARIEEREPPRGVDRSAVQRHTQDARIVVPEALGLAPEHVTYRLRRRRAGGEPYRGGEETAGLHEVREGGLRFLVSLGQYLDTGLFLDHRDLRALVLEAARGQDFLNLFAHTCTATVYAAAGGARSTTSVDLSNTYLEWGGKNLALNGLDGRQHSMIKAECLDWLKRARPGRYGLVLAAPPAFSKGKAMRGTFDVQRDHVTLLGACARVLAPSGVLLFSAPLRTFELDRAGLGDLDVQELRTVPLDFARSPDVHRSFRITRPG